MYRAIDLHRNDKISITNRLRRKEISYHHYSLKTKHTSITSSALKITLYENTLGGNKNPAQSSEVYLLYTLE